jgi:CheY-like chemotaxis protein
MSFAVKKLGYTVEMAEDGRQALELLREQPFDLVLLDIIMPELDGYQVLEQMKADSRLRHIPVIVISAEQELDSVVKGIELGAEDYLPKTFDTKPHSGIQSCAGNKTEGTHKGCPTIFDARTRIGMSQSY